MRRMYVLSESRMECEYCETDQEYDMIKVSTAILVIHIHKTGFGAAVSVG
jgi:hypothetical protein